MQLKRVSTQLNSKTYERKNASFFCYELSREHGTRPPSTTSERRRRKFDATCQFYRSLVYKFVLPGTGTPSPYLYFVLWMDHLSTSSRNFRHGMKAQPNFMVFSFRRSRYLGRYFVTTSTVEAEFGTPTCNDPVIISTGTTSVKLL